MAAEAPSEACTLPYPDRFHCALEFVDKPPKGAKTLPDESRLILYALGQQATEGPCTQPKPWGWNIVENAKWQSWRQLGDLSGIEAMRLYVRALEDVEPGWWSQQQRSKEEAKAVAAAVDKQPLWPPALAQAAAPAAWAQLEVAGKHPSTRYDHAMARIATQVYVVGGSCGGRYLSDVWVLDIEKLTWRLASCTAAAADASGSSGKAGEESDGIAAAGESSSAPGPAFEPLAGHKLVTWGTTVLCIGGHTKAKNPKAPLTVWALDTTSMAWSKLHIRGEEAPVNRGSHTATVVGKRVYIFGGEDVMRRPLGDLWALDLEAMAWIKPQATGTAPRERSAHVATCFRGRYVALFGGGSLAHCFSDLHVLDTESMVWSKPSTEGGFSPTPRAGCAGALLTDRWFVMGGGDNTGGCTDMVVLDLKPLASGGPLAWELVEQVDKASAIACEGMGVVPVTTAALLLAFGGYNGKYHNTLHLYQPAGVAPESEASVGSPLKVPASAKSAASAAAATAAAPAANGSAAPTERKQSADADTSPSALAEPGVAGTPAAPVAGGGGTRVAELEAALSSAQAEAAKAAKAEEASWQEAEQLRQQLAAAQAAQKDAEKASASAREQLEGESSKCFKLEVEAAELRKRLGKMEELEKELERYRLQAKEAEAQKGKGGLWGYISGS